MKRSIRRHQQRTAKVRKLRILYGHAHGCSFQAFDRLLCGGPYTYAERPWKGFHRMCMSEPGWWVREMMTRPARVNARRIAHSIVTGADPDGFQWPDSRKPHSYYW